MDVLIGGEDEFDAVALSVFQFQAQHLPVYADFMRMLGINWQEVKSRDAIPHLPISFFKSHRLLAEGCTCEIAFTSSGTTGSQTSSHYVHSLELYRRSFVKGFERAYGAMSGYAFLALLPSYQERQGSSLIYMADYLIAQSAFSESGYYLNADEQLLKVMEALEQRGQPYVLLGVTYALLDLAAVAKGRRMPALQHGIVMETGGMKGRRREMIREEVHEVLCDGFGIEVVHSEYGMTELLSQAYSKGKGVFECPPWMRVSVREVNDAFAAAPLGQTGGVNVIDLANLYSCAFIATQDLGRLVGDGRFELLGRFDNSDIRGCNLLVG